MDVFVAVDGNDANGGGRAEPKATVRAVVAAARARGGAARVVVGQGEYFVDETIVLDARDSGLTIAAAEGARPVLYGGRPVTGWVREGTMLADPLVEIDEAGRCRFLAGSPAPGLGIEPVDVSDAGVLPLEQERSEGR